jgi:hypothetical protein
MNKQFTIKKLLSLYISSIVEKTALVIDKKLQGKFESKEKKLGFDWSFLKHSKDPIDAVKAFKREVKWGLQRFAQGYDNQMFWALDSYLDEFIMISLEWYIKHRHGSPVFKEDGWTEEDCHEKYTKELKKMLDYFEQSDDRWCKEKNEYEDIVPLDSYFLPSGRGTYTMKYKDMSPEAEELREKWYQRGRKIDAYKQAQHAKALQMLIKYYTTLWD